MARSNTGGTRGFLRGKIASELYQVTKDARGKKIQLVRAVEDWRFNPNTRKQAVARMQMALCMGSLTQFKELVDHSWENIPYGQLSIAHFVNLNMPLIQADCNDHWDGGAVFDYPYKGFSDVRLGPFIMSEGNLTLPSAVRSRVSGFFDRDLFMDYVLGKSSPTYSDLKAALGANAGDYITFVVLRGRDGADVPNAIIYLRVYLAAKISPEAVITQDNVNTFFTFEGNTQFTTTINAQGTISFQVIDTKYPSLRYNTACCIICSKWNGRKWQRNNAQFAPPGNDEDPWRENKQPRDVFQSWWPEYDPDE